MSAESLKSKFVKLEVPFDLNAIFTLSYNFDGLKEVLQFILDHIGTLKGDINEVDTKMMTKLMQISKNKEAIEELKKKNASQDNILKELEEKSCITDEDCSNLRTNMEMMKMNHSLLKREVEDSQEETNVHIENFNQQINLLIEQVNNFKIPEPVKVDGQTIVQNVGPDMDTLRKQFAMKPDHDIAIKRIEALENQPVVKNESGPQMPSDLLDRLNKMQQQLQQHDLAIQGMGKLDQLAALGELAANLVKRVENLEKDNVKWNEWEPKWQQMHDDIEALKAQIQALGSMKNSGGTVDTSQFTLKIAQLEAEIKKKCDKFDLNAVKEELRREWSQDIRDMRKEIDASLDGLRFEIERTKNDFDSFKLKEHAELMQRVSILEKKLTHLTSQVHNLKVPTNQDNNNVDDSLLRELADRLGALERDVQDLKNQFSKWIKEMQDSLNQKADLSALKELDQVFMDRLNDIVKALSKQFADKKETQKALKLLDKQLKNLYDLFMSQSKGDNEDDGMFTKKPLGGLSCASCEKNIINLHGKRVDYMPWSKLPFRDPQERIARVGQGFSKMLSMINPDQLSRYDGNSKMQGNIEGGHQQMTTNLGGSADNFYMPQEIQQQEMNNAESAQKTRFPDATAQPHQATRAFNQSFKPSTADNGGRSGSAQMTRPIKRGVRK